MLNIITNHVPRSVVYAYELTAGGREELGLPADGHPEYPDTEYVRYRGTLYPLSDFQTTARGAWGGNDELARMGWDGYLTDTFFSGVCIRYPRDGENINTDSVIVGRFYACECSEDYGPCSQHSEQIAQRVGSSNRSADELCAVFLSDAADALTDAGQSFPAEWDDVRGLVDDAESWDGSWLRADLTVPGASDGYTASDALREATEAAESALGGVGLSVSWDDGYVIYRLTGGPLSR